jgi:hypothetical protein
MRPCEHTPHLPEVSLSLTTPRMFKTPFEVSKSARHHVQSHNEQGLEASSILPRRVIQSDFSNPVLTASWKNASVFSVLKTRKDPTLPSTYRPISLLDTIGKLFEKIFLTRIPFCVSGRGLLRNERFGFRPKYSTALQLINP